MLAGALGGGGQECVLLLLQAGGWSQAMPPLWALLALGCLRLGSGKPGGELGGALLGEKLSMGSFIESPLEKDFACWPWDCLILFTNTNDLQHSFLGDPWVERRRQF